MVSIESVAKVITGKTPPKADPNCFGGNIPFITPSELTDSNYLLKPETTLTEKGLATTKLIPKNSILVCCIGSLGKMAMADLPVATNQQINSVIFDEDKIYYRFGFYALKLLKNELKNIAPSTTVAIVNKSRFSELKIPSPPLEEQKRIAAILDKAADICQKREQATKLVDDFLHSIFLEMFGDPVENPKGWKKDKIKKGVLDITSGWSATGENIPCKSNEFGVLKISSVTSGIFKPEENKVVDCKTIPASKKLIRPKKGDLLFSRANTRELVAAICMVHQDYDNLFLPDKLWSIKLNHELLLPEFFLILIQNEKVRELLTKQATGTSGSMLNISKNKFEETEIIFPEINVQKDFCNAFRKTMNLKAKLIKSNELANESFNSLSQKVF
ncbi:restriction endonuclease subunit S [Salmonella enterica subsp. enterica]|nr:restriction endonuclease subunit S [Salmonella enterica]EAC0472175.1 restriction endonuclease subunit S [Salmonella enterica subsp. enterica serovar Tornow]EBF8507480.1 restriction endonuclease subunit S [Salmonella enterica subsp. enterica serovar Matopeni]ECC2957577.1 restriction endonuclease subunit S [Salmonella enterica subsp. enterica]ECQ6564459.1 restriction endonuclease subunit S [Salmonella enterica subsp. enterica serovar Kintambo]